jgi:hypothetical protein
MTTSPFARSTGYARVMVKVVVRVRDKVIIIEWDLDWVRVGSRVCPRACVYYQYCMQELPEGLVHSCEHGRRQENRHKNKFINIIPCKCDSCCICVDVMTS